MDDRIKMHYGKKFGLVVESEKYESTKIAGIEFDVSIKVTAPERKVDIRNQIQMV